MLQQGNVGEARLILRRVLQFGLLSGAALAAVMLALNPLLPTLFSKDADVASQASTALLVVSGSMVRHRMSSSWQS